MKTSRDKIPLNGLEKFILLNESPKVAYNSQVVMEFDGQLSPDYFKKVIIQALTDIPWLRMMVQEKRFGFQRYILQASEIDLDKCLIVYPQILSQEQIDQFCSTKFDLSTGHCFSFALSPLHGQRTQLIFNVHHSVCDGMGLFLLLSEFFKILNGKPVSPEAKKYQTFRYRSLIKKMGVKWFFSHLWKNRKGLKKQRKYKMSTLIDNPTCQSRDVTSIHFYLTEIQKENIRANCKKHNVGSSDYLIWVIFKALDQLLRERGDFDTPLMAYIPKSIRRYLNIRHSFQNIISSVVVVGERKKIFQFNYLQKIKKTILMHKMDQAAKFIFTNLFPLNFIPNHKLKNFFQTMDYDPNNSTCTVLFSSGKILKSVELPHEWKNIDIWARGTLLKSPGFGVIHTGINQRETLTFEFIKGLIDRTTIDRFLHYFWPIINAPQASTEENVTKHYEIKMNFPNQTNSSEELQVIL